MRILIVDDHPVYAEGLKNLLIAYHYEDVVVAGSGNEAVSVAPSLKPDVVFMDIGMPGKDGIEATAEIKRNLPATKIVMLTSLAEDESLFRAVKAGASGYLIKTAGGDELVRCLSELEAGRNPFSKGLEESLLTEFRRAYSRPNEAKLSGAEAGASALTERQREVLDCLARGMSYKEAGASLYISERTVKFHIEQIKSVLGLRTKEELVAFAKRD